MNETGFIYLLFAPYIVGVIAYVTVIVAMVISIALADKKTTKTDSVQIKEPVGKIDDLSDNGNNATQSVETSQPMLNTIDVDKKPNVFSDESEIKDYLKNTVRQYITAAMEADNDDERQRANVYFRASVHLIKRINPNIEDFS
jgi:hypothetical protein